MDRVVSEIARYCNTGEMDDAESLLASLQFSLDPNQQPPTTEKSSVVQPQAEQPAMTPIAQRKMDSLLASGYTISGYSVYHEQKHQHGLVTGAGLVGWWKPEGVEYPQPQGEQLKGCHKIEKPCRVGEWNFGVGNLCRRVIEEAQRQYNRPQPKREPLTDEQIDAIADAMPGGLEGFLRGWGWRQFARAVIEATHNIK